MNLCKALDVCAGTAVSGLLDPQSIGVSPPTTGPATSSMSRPASQANGRQAQWVFHETCRLAHVILDPTVGAALARSATGLTRPELDARLVAPFDAEFFQLFNNSEFKPAHPEPTNILLAGMNPNSFTRREGHTLKTKYSDMRKEFTIVYDNWSKSGQNNPDNFWDAGHGAQDCSRQ